MTKKQTKLKLSKYDRIQAIIRCPQFLKEHKFIQSIKVKETNPDHWLYLGFLARWGIECYAFDDLFKMAQLSEKVFNSIYPLNPVKVVSPERWKEPWLREELKGQRLLRGREATKPKNKPISPKQSKALLRKLLTPKERNTFFTSHLEDGCYLTLRIDLRAERKEILKLVGKQLTFHRKYVKPQEKGKIRETTYNPWIVYTLHKEGKTYEEIVMTVAPTQDKDLLLSRIDTVRSAYRKACKMIKDVTPVQ